MPELIAFDNCCHWENKLASVYPESIIKLDLFHAIKRVTDEVSKKSKKHIFQSAFSKDFAMAFRSGGDNGSDNQKSREKDKETIVKPIWSMLTHIPLSHVTTTNSEENSVKIRSTDVFSYLAAESCSSVTPGDHDYATFSTGNTLVLVFFRERIL